MKKLILLNLFMTLTVLSFAQADCEQFKTGKFSYTVDDNKVVVIRTDTTQKEHDKKSGLKINYKIRWTSPCEYQLIQVWSNDKGVFKNQGDIIKVKITKVMADSYEYTAELYGKITQHTIVRMKK